MTTTSARQQQRRRTAAQWATENPTLNAGEFGVTTDTGVLKIGPGAWNDLEDIVGPDLATSDPAKVPLSTTGGVTTLNVAALAWAPLVVVLASNQTVNNSTTLVNATGLVAAVAANTTYLVDTHVFYQSSNVADIKFAWTTPAGVSGRWSAQGLAPSATALNGVFQGQSSDWATEIALGGPGTGAAYANLVGTLVVGGTAGNLQLQLAQNTLEATNTILRGGESMLKIQRLLP